LVICKKIVDELGGSIEVSSKEGEYTVFTVKLPIAEPKREVECAEAIGQVVHLIKDIPGENNE